jgi:cell division protein FtsN
MPSDYKSRLDKKKSNKSMPGFVWLLSGLAIGLFVAFIVYLDKQPENDSDFGSAVQRELDQLKQKAQQDKSKTGSPATTTTKATSKSGDPQKKKQKFNFYTLLPDMEVLIPEDETRPPKTASEKSSSAEQASGQAAIKDDHRYILQVGSFQNRGDAEKLKANLAFLGVHAEVQSVSINAQRWHRVRTGPYHNRQELYHNKKLLKDNHIDSIPVELK